MDKVVKGLVEREKSLGEDGGEGTCTRRDNREGGGYGEGVWVKELRALLSILEVFPTYIMEKFRMVYCGGKITPAWLHLQVGRP